MKIILGVLAGLAVAAAAVAGACVLLVGGTAIKTADAIEQGQKVRAVEQQAQTDYRRKLAVKLGEVEARGAYCYINGAVTNTGNRTVTYWRVSLRYFDTKDRVIDRSFTNSLDRLGPGESKTFRTMYRCSVRFRVEAEPEEVKIL